MAELHHSIKAVSRKTGLSPHVIRVWERRYKAVEPTRTGSNRRLYSDTDVERLGLLRRATQAGHSISNVAGLPMDRLMKIAAEAAAASTAGSPKSAAVTPESIVEDCLAAIRQLNTRELDHTLTRGILAFGQHGLLQKVIGPLVQTVGELWRDGSILAAHEHFASAAIRNFLGRNAKPFAPHDGAATLVVGTPSGQLHELGAVMVAAAANDMGWRVIYLGPSLPAAEIAAAVAQNRARAVALSLVYPEDDPNLPAELENLRQYLPAETRILVGGRAAPAYEASLRKIGALRLKDLKDFYAHLDELRAS